MAFGLLLIGAWVFLANRSGWKHWLPSLRISWFSAHTAADPEPGGQDVPLDEQVVFHGDGQADLGSFQVTRFELAGETCLSVSFALKGQLAKGGEDVLGPYARQHPRQFREQVNATIRDTTVGSLADAKSLGRKLAVKLNRSLGARYFQTIEVEDLEVYEMRAADASTPWEPVEMDTP